MRFFSIGQDNDHPDYINKKIELSNQIIVVIFFLVLIPSFLICFFYVRKLTFIPITGTLISVLIISLNYFKWYTLARIVLSLLPITLTNIYGGYLVSEGQPVLPGFAMMSLSFSFLFFLIIDFKEKFLFGSMAMAMLLLVLSMDWFNNVFEMELEREVIEMGFLLKLPVLTSTLTGAGCLLLVILQHKKTEQKATLLLSDASQNQQKMLEKEEELKKNIQVLEKSKKEEQQRQWTNEGLNETITLMRDTNDSELLYDMLISYIVKRTNSNQGGLFFINDNNPDDTYLELVAAYAYNRKKFINRRIEIGEGLIGQIYIEKEYLLLKEVPDDYVNITSGLGGANPNYILIMPIKVNEIVYGVLELASFNELEPYKITFLTCLVENIASSFNNNQVNTKTKRLLESTQQQAEELRSQEEELRQNQEELNAVQEQLNHQKNELENEIQNLKVRLKEYENS